MGIFEFKALKDAENYIHVFNAIEFLTWITGDEPRAVVKGLLREEFENHIETYIKNETDKFLSNDDFFSGVFQKTYTILKCILNLKNIGECHELNSFNHPELLTYEDCYWLQSDLFRFVEPIIELEITQEQFFNFKKFQAHKNLKSLHQEQVSTWIQTENNQNIIEQKENEAITHSPIEPYKLFLLKKPLLSIHEAACIISEDDPNIVTRCEHDTNFDQNFNNYLHAFNFVDAAIKANDLACDDSQFYGIKNTDLKNYLISTGIIVDGFTDTIPAQNQSNFGTPAIQQTIPNIENYTKEIESLKAALDQAQVRIKELEAKQTVEQPQIQTNELESKLSTREKNNILRVLAVLADMEKKIDISKPYEAHGIMLAKANLLGIEPFPSNESIKKWFSEANEFKNPN